MNAYNPEHYTWTRNGIVYATIDNIKQANAAIGHHYFDAGTLRFFSSRIGSKTYCGKAGIFFVTSEQFDYKSPRFYSVRRFDYLTGACDTASEFQEYETSAQANRAAQKYADGILPEVGAKIG